MKFSFIFDSIFEFLDIIITFGDRIFKLFFYPLSQTPIGQLLPDLILDMIGDFTLLGLMFGAGLVTFVAYTLIKWILGVVT